MMMRMSRVLGLLAVLGLFLGACSDDDDSASDTTGGGTTGDEEGVGVILSEWIVESDTDPIAAGEVTIVASNDGAEVHELVIVKGDDPDALPIDEDGKVLEDELEEGAFIGEIEEFDSGTSETGVFELEVGSYIFFCNIVEEEADGTFESHFLEGMETVVTVE